MKLAVVASGWHFPLDFYESVARQIVVKDWQYDLFCISHRDPKYSKEEKSGLNLKEFDTILYKEIATIEQIKQLGWNYKEYPNTVGDWGCSNQWLEEHNFTEYDLLLFTHDDNFIHNYKWFGNIIHFMNEDWEILSNSCGDPVGWLRGSCEFFKPSLLHKIGGKFDLSLVDLNREGEVYSPDKWVDLFDWNNTVHPLMKFCKENKVPIGYLSKTYRHSMFVSEGERGFISPILKK